MAWVDWAALFLKGGVVSILHIESSYKMLKMKKYTDVIAFTLNHSKSSASSTVVVCLCVTEKKSQLQFACWLSWQLKDASRRMLAERGQKFAAVQSHRHWHDCAQVDRGCVFDYQSQPWLFFSSCCLDRPLGRAGASW